MIKHTLYLFIVLVSLNASAQRQKTRATDKQKITSLLMRQQEAWNNGKLEEFMSGYWNNDSLIFVGKKGLTRGWNQTLENYRKSYPTSEKMGKLTFQLLEVNVLSAQHAFVIGKWKLTRKGGNLEGHFTLFLKKINAAWLIIADHSS
jgi:hypothetical protein